MYSQEKIRLGSFLGEEASTGWLESPSLMRLPQYRRGGEIREQQH